jgi:hypothetical protein
MGYMGHGRKKCPKFVTKIPIFTNSNRVHLDSTSNHSKSCKGLIFNAFCTIVRSNGYYLAKLAFFSNFNNFLVINESSVRKFFFKNFIPNEIKYTKKLCITKFLVFTVLERNLVFRLFYVIRNFTSACTLVRGLILL